MNLQDRVACLEDEIDHLRAIVDGGEVQHREAIVVTIGLLASFAARDGGLDLGHLIEFLSDGFEPEPSRDDRTAMMLHGIRLILAYHRDLKVRPSMPPPAVSPIGDEER